MGYCVYRHTSPDGRVYIGATCQSAEKRWANGRGYSYNTEFDEAIRTFGWNNFTHEVILDDVSKADACAAERELIRKHKSDDPRFGFNHHPGGTGSNVGVICSDETRKKRSEKMKGRMNGWFVGRNSAKAKQVNQYDTEGRFIQTWYATTEAQSELGIPYTSIVKCCTRQYRTAGGFIWRYIDDDADVMDLACTLHEPKHLSDAHKQAIKAGVIRARRLSLAHCR